MEAEGRARGEEEAGGLIGVEAEDEDSKVVWEVRERERLLRALGTIEGDHMHACLMAMGWLG